MKPEQEKVKNLLLETISLLCKNGLMYHRKLNILGLLGITIDDNEVFIVHVNELFSTAASCRENQQTASSAGRHLNRENTHLVTDQSTAECALLCGSPLLQSAGVDVRGTGCVNKVLPLDQLGFDAGQSSTNRCDYDLSEENSAEEIFSAQNQLAEGGDSVVFDEHLMHVENIDKVMMKTTDVDHVKISPGSDQYPIIVEPEPNAAPPNRSERINVSTASLPIHHAQRRLSQSQCGLKPVNEPDFLTSANNEMQLMSSSGEPCGTSNLDGWDPGFGQQLVSESDILCNLRKAQNRNAFCFRPKHRKVLPGVNRGGGVNTSNRLSQLNRRNMSSASAVGHCGAAPPFRVKTEPEFVQQFDSAASVSVAGYGFASSSQRNFAYKNRLWVTNHLERYNGIRLRTPRRPSDSMEKRFRCQLCGLSYYYKSHLLFHVRKKHEGNELYSPDVTADLQ